jgi:hypothetical protein
LARASERKTNVIENRDLPAGTRLAVRHKGTVHTCEVVRTKDGLRYRLKDGKEFNSPSSAGREITNAVAVNGRSFWSLEGDLKERRAKEPKAKTIAEVKDVGGRAARSKAKAAKTIAKETAKGKGKKAAKKKVARAASKGDAYGCGVCGETFPTLKAATKHTISHTA